MTPTTHQSNFIQPTEASANSSVTVSAVTAHQSKPAPVDLTVMHEYCFSNLCNIIIMHASDIHVITVDLT